MSEHPGAGGLAAVADSQDPMADLANPSSNLRRVLDSLPMAVVGTDLQAVVKYWNPAAERLFGYTRAEVIDKDYPLAPPGEQREEAALNFARLREGVTAQGRSIKRAGKHGRPVEAALWGHLLQGADGAALGLLGFMVDQTQQRRVERENRGLFELAHDAILILDPDDERVLDVNPSACALYGFSREEFLGKSMLELSAGAGLVGAHVASTRQKKHGHHFQSRQLNKAGELLVLEIKASLLEFGGKPAILSINRDVSERELANAAINQSQKMEALGQMAGGVAHDFNNLLTALVGYPELIRKALPPGHPARVYLAPMEEAASRAAEMTRHLLAFSRGQVVDMGPVDLDELVAAMQAGLQAALRPEIRLVLGLNAPGVRIRGHHAELERVVMNLVHNARDALPMGGSVRIETELQPSPEGEPAQLWLRVSDDGEGMPESVRRQVFDPFFTTKDSGKGTGLGLSTVYGIVKQHEGHIELSSTPGEGTRFDMRFPVLIVDPLARPSRPRERTPSLTEGEGVILLVEDDEVVRVMALQSLQRAGYRVYATHDGNEAMSFIRGGATVDLVVSDLLMPGMGGAELREALLQLRPHLPILLMSGYAGRGDAALPNGVAFMNKPFTPSELTAKVAELLQGAPPRA